MKKGQDCQRRNRVRTVSQLIRQRSSFVLFVLLTVFLCMRCEISSMGMIHGEAERTVRVAYPIQSGLTEIEENGNYSGYTYEYLKEIAQYTGWEYEFILYEGSSNEQLMQSLQDVLDGKVDLLSGVVYTEALAEQMDYASYNYGTSQYALCVSEKNTRITGSNYTTFPNLRVAVPNSKEKMNVALDQLSKMNGSSILQVFYPDEEAAQKALKEGEVDAILVTDISNSVEGVRTITKFSPKPFYFTTTKGNQEIVQGLNSAMLNITEANPYFSTELHEKYFGRDKSKLFFSEEEQAYLLTAPVLRVGMLLGRAPIQYKDENGEIQGLVRDILGYITEATSLQFEIVAAETYDDLLQLIQQQKIDLIAGISDTNAIGEVDAYIMTTPYINTDISIAMREGINFEQFSEHILAIPKLTYHEYNSNSLNVREYDTLEECLNAVNKGEADYCYDNNYTLQYYMKRKSYKNINIVPDSSLYTQRERFAMLKPVDVNALTIMNKGIQSVPEAELQRFLYANVIQQEKITFLSYIKSNPTHAFMGAVATLLLFITALLLWYSHTYKVLNRTIRLENEDYAQRETLLLARAELDSLTEIYNTATSKQLIGQNLEEREEGKSGALLILDIDYFKSVNDQLGHFVGDAVLREVASVLKSTFRKEDIVGRLGGDEFIVYMKDISGREEVAYRCEKLKEKVKSTTLKEQQWAISLSIGAAMVDKDYDYEYYYRNADRALYQVKNGGKDGFHIVSS